MAYLSVSDVTLTEGNAGTTPATFTEARPGNLAGPSTVKAATATATAATTATATTATAAATTASAGADYTALVSTTVSFAAGEASKTVSVDITGDTADEADETFNLTLAQPPAPSSPTPRASPPSSTTTAEVEASR